ncbi:MULTISPECIES: SusC/RagA family TonB-linked outer membrane protein [unclassified Proteiniphilum]|jgi:TonB-linked SusC/RagA family outer membrane protein|uniref:SusC/RagA family TonB-linked outer membrane protein n=1 Tax=unclassified Proteiniphilum TaxID=2622718 RepID=UPI0025801B5D|nr:MULTISPECIES: TonB-dependent receptor [unclassified Proteiniphilum]
MKIMLQKMDKMYRIALLVMVLGCLDFGNLSASVQHDGSFPAESMVERMERLNEMGKLTGQTVSYNATEIRDEVVPSIETETNNMEEWLYKSLKGSKFTYEKRNSTHYLIVRNKQEIKNEPEQGRQVSVLQGRVTGIRNEPLIGVNIVENGTLNGTVTDKNGYYSLSVPSDAVIVFSYIGYTAQEIPRNKRNTINVILGEDSELLDEVVVVGYGTQKKINLTGSVASVQGDVLENRPVGTVGVGLQGMLPGVTITSSSGQPGSPGLNVLVRGVNTIHSQTTPLILIDGVSGGDINLVNPDDIESVVVLKDAAASAIYGARAANGVILVTTKKGKKEGKPMINYTGYVGIQTPTSLPELVNGREYMTLSNEARNARGVAIPYTDEAFMKYDSKNFPNDYSNTNWVNAVYKKHATQQSHNVNINGRGAHTSYYMSYGFLNQTGLIVGDPYSSSRHNIRLRLITDLTDRLRIDGNVSFVDFYRKDAGGAGTAGVFRLVQRISPLLPIKWQLPSDDGNWQDSPYWSYGSVSNPVRVAYESGYSKNYSRTFNGNFNATLHLVEGMDVNAQYAYNYYTRDIKDWSPTMPRFLADGTPHSGNNQAVNTIFESRSSTVTQTFNTTLNYEKQFSRHELKFLAGFSQESAQIPYLSASRQKVLLEGIEVIDAGTENITNSGTEEHWALRSCFGRLNYDFASRYLFEANIRYDGTSRFSRNNRWGTFPSFSAGWRFSEEEFMDFSKKYLDSGKFRVSWGELGNQNISSDYYPYLTEIERVEKTYPIGNKENVGFKQYSLANENIKWETIRMFNIGVDLVVLNNRLDLTFDWFKKTNRNALLKPVYPSVIGITSTSNLPFENVGSIENEGWELSLNWRDKIGRVNYGFTSNLSDAKNKITDLGNSTPSLGNNIRRVGDPINAYYGYLTDGLAQITDFESYNETSQKYVNPKFPVISSYAAIIQPGDIIYRDISGENGEPDGRIDEYDKVVFGNPYPRYTYSLRGFAEWGNFNFSFYLQGVAKVNGYLSEEARHAFINDYSIPKKAHLDRWTPNNLDASYPRMYYQADHNIVFSNYWLEDASYLRLKNIQLGYNLPKHLISRIKVDRLKVYLTIDNLFTLTNYFGGFDPEVRETSGDAYPQLKTYAIGVQLGF